MKKKRAVAKKTVQKKAVKKTVHRKPIGTSKNKRATKKTTLHYSLAELDKVLGLDFTKERSTKGTYILHTQLDGSKASRAVAISARANLFDLAFTVIKAYDFKFDHPFGFYGPTNGDLYDAEVQYDLFTDMISEGEDLEPTGAKSVKGTKLADVWKFPGDEMTMVFDFGHDYRFRIVLFAHTVVEVRRPEILRKVGRAPKQY
jgi:Plasmid pRiA4b ORF-3-like protein